MLDKVEKPTEIAQSKLIALRDYISELDHVLVAYSGGVDSAFLLRVAYEELRENCRAFTARSPSLMDIELEEAVKLAKQIGMQIGTLRRDDYRRRTVWFCDGLGRIQRRRPFGSSPRT